MARGGDLFVLEMGAPARIRELAEKMVRLSGRSIRDEANSDGDIAIEVTGLRPGEKMHEELLIDGDATGTMHPRILEMKESVSDLGSLESELARLEGNAHAETIQAGIRALLAKWVAGYPREEGHQERASLRAVPSGARQ